MDNLLKDEELQFFNALDEIESVPDTSDSRSTSDSSTEEKNSSYEMWIRSPKSVEERRRTFLDGIGIGNDQIFSRNSVSWSDSEENFEKVRENCSGAVLRNSGFAQEECSSSLSSASSMCSSSGLDLSEHVCLKERANERECSRRSLEFKNTSSEMSQENEKQSPYGGLMRSLKKGWLGRMRSMGCVVDKQCVTGKSGLSQVWEDARFGRDGGSVRVKVRQFKKQAKELSALYKGQEIRAHEGAILTMKFSQDGKFLASAGEDGIVRVWKVAEEKRSGQQNAYRTDPFSQYFEINDFSELKMKPGLVEDEEKTGKLRRNPDSACVVFPPKAFRISEKPLHEFRGHKGEILDLSWSRKNYLLSASVDNTVRLWRIGHDGCLRVFNHSNYVTSVQFNPINKNYFISGSIDGKIRIWQISDRRVVDWADIRDIVTAVCYRPDGQGGIIGTLTGKCRFFNISDSQLELDAEICLHSKKKSPSRRIIGFQFFPQDPSKVIVSSADSRVIILHGFNVIGKYKGPSDAAMHTSASFTSDGKHIVSACEDSNVYVWNSTDEKERSFHPKKIKSCERFSADASVAIPWNGFSEDTSLQTLPFSSPSCFSPCKDCVLRPTATWPEESLSMCPSSSSSMGRSQYKFLKASYRNALSSHAWGMVIVTAGWDGRIRSFQNYGLPAVPA